MAKSKSQKSSSAQRATASQQSSTTQRSSTQASSTAPKSAQTGSAGQRTSAAQRREVQRQQQMASAERNRAKTRSTHGGSRGRKQASPAVSPIVWVAVALLVVAAVVGIFFYLSNQSSSSGLAINGRKAAPAQVVNEVTNVKTSVLQTVDIGNVQTTPTPLSGQPPLTGSSGKPEFFYFGAEYCPYCAAQRWAMIVALSRFGTFKNLSITTSSTSDVYPSTPTFSFYGSSYSSPYVDFVSVETTTNQSDGNGGYVTLETPTAAQQQIVSTYDASPYTSQSGSIPFIDIGGRYLMIGPGFSPQLLQNENWQQIASALSNPSSPITQGIVGTANYLTAAICNSTNQKPASVCQAAPIPAIETALNKTTGFNASGPQFATIGNAPVAYVKRQD